MKKEHNTYETKIIWNIQCDRPHGYIVIDSIDDSYLESTPNELWYIQEYLETR